MAAPADKRYRPFRAASWGFYLVFSVSFSLLITWNVVRSVLAMTPSRPPKVDAMLSPVECLATARGLWGELDGRRRALSDAAPVRLADAEWTRFRVEWLARHKAAEGGCAAADRPELRRLYRSLEATMDRYTTHAVQFAGEVGPTVDRLRADLEAAAK